MKKLFAALLALTMLVGMFALTSCNKAKPELDLEKAEKALEDAKYTVVVADKKEDIDMPGVEKMLRAADEKYENHLYIYVFEDAKTAKLFYQQMKVSYDQQIEQLELEIKYYELILDTYKDDMDSDAIDDMEDELKDMKEELEEYKEDYSFGRDGKTVWNGTVKAVEATIKD